MYRYLPLVVFLIILAGCCSARQSRDPQTCYAMMWDGVRDTVMQPLVDPPIKGYSEFVVPELRKDSHAVIEHLIVNLEIGDYDGRKTVRTDRGVTFVNEIIMSHWMLDRCIEHDMKFFPDEIYTMSRTRYMPEVCYLTYGANKHRIAKMWRDYWEENKSRMYWDEETQKMRLIR